MVRFVMRTMDAVNSGEDPMATGLLVVCAAVCMNLCQGDAKSSQLPLDDVLPLLEVFEMILLLIKVVEV